MRVLFQSLAIQPYIQRAQDLISVEVHVRGARILRVFAFKVARDFLGKLENRGFLGTLDFFCV